MRGECRVLSAECGVAAVPFSEAFLRRQAALLKLCEGCGGLIVRRAATCPRCAAYRFDEDVAAIVERIRRRE